MNLRELSREVAKETGYGIVDIERIISCYIKVLVKVLLQGHAVALCNFVSFKLDVVKEKKIYLPTFSGTKPRRFKLFVKQSRKFKQQVDAKKAY